MKKVSFTIIAILTTLTLYGQEITGTWHGTLDVQGISLRLVFHVDKTAASYNATMDSPDQGAKGIPVTTTSFENDTLRFTVASAMIRYEGVLNEAGQVIGTFHQAGQSFPLNLLREMGKKTKLVRPQEPVEPYGYHVESVIFENKKAGITLAGTLTMPPTKRNFPAVVLISGSGPQNRDEELMGHKPFLVLSDYLTKKGIAVLRFDDRGVGQSTGDFSAATSLDFATDVAAAVAYLETRKEIDKSNIGLIGHSEGGLIAPLVANQSEAIAFIVMLAGPGIPGDQLLLLQQAYIQRASGVDEAEVMEIEQAHREAFDIIKKTKDTIQLKTSLAEYIEKAVQKMPRETIPEGMSVKDFVDMYVKQLTNPWMHFFIQYDPIPALKQVTCPVFAINGEKDLQVPPDENLAAIQAALSQQGNITTKVLPGLNHLFQESETGLPNEYGTITQTFSPIALEAIYQWISKQVK